MIMCVFSIFPFRFLRGHIIRLANETDSIALVKLFAWNVCKMSEREWIECYKSGNESSGIIPWKMLKRVMIIRIIAWKMSKRVMKLLLARLRPSFPGTAKLSSCSCIITSMLRAPTTLYCPSGSSEKNQYIRSWS